MKTPPLIPSFFLGLFAFFFGTVFFPSFRLIVFAPFLAIVFQQKSFLYSLWMAAFVGLIVDLFNTEFRFGLFSLSYILTTLGSYREKRRFFEESLLTLPLYTTLISFVFSVVTFCLITFFHQRLSFNISVLFTNFLILPLVDGLYGFLWFSCPMILYNIFKRNRLYHS